VSLYKLIGVVDLLVGQSYIGDILNFKLCFLH